MLVSTGSQSSVRLVLLDERVEFAQWQCIAAQTPLVKVFFHGFYDGLGNFMGRSHGNNNRRVVFGAADDPGEGQLTDTCILD